MRMKTLRIRGTTLTSSRRVIDEDGNIVYLDMYDKPHRLDGPAVEYPNGDKEWYFHGELHRLDGAAAISHRGDKAWYVSGKKHRLDGPAIEVVNGERQWWIRGVKKTEEEFNRIVEHVRVETSPGGDRFYLNGSGKLSRTDGPAGEKANGDRLWIVDGQIHRTDGPAVELAGGERMWMFNDMDHRIGGPAIEKPNGYKEWRVNGERHRLDGPAIEKEDGEKSWFIENRYYFSEEDYNDRIRVLKENLGLLLPDKCPSEPEKDPEVPKCKEIFIPEFTDRDYPLGRILNDLFNDCNAMEAPFDDYESLDQIVNLLRSRFPVMERVITIPVRRGLEMASAVMHFDAFPRFIPQAESTNTRLRIKYIDQAGIDYGGLTRQFISTVMDQITNVLFEPLEMAAVPYVKLLDSMTEEEKKRAMVEASKPKYHLTKKSYSEIARIFKYEDVDEIFGLAGRMFAYAAINKVPFRIPLSRVLRRMMLGESEISENEMLASYILDTGTTLSKEINLRFEYAEDDDREILIDYLNELEVTLRDSSKRAYEFKDRRLEAFLLGFEGVGRILKEQNVTINGLEALITKHEITSDDMESLLGRVVINMDTTDEVTGRRLVERLGQTIMDIGDYSQFLLWWTGSPVILDKEYKVNILPPISEDDPAALFNAHTCFFTFDIRANIIDSPNFLEEFKAEIKNVGFTTA